MTVADVHSPFVAAAVQASPVFLDADATADKAARLIAEAAGNGAKLVAFPEVFVPGYPYWNWIMSPLAGSKWFHRLHDASVSATGPEVRKIAAAAKKYGCHVVVGINERSDIGVGTIFNTVLTIDDNGFLIGRHRKLVPTWAEKLTWTGGDGSSLVVHDTSLGPLGVLACGENTNTLARFALLERGELIHVSAYISLPTAPADYDMSAAIQTRSAAHAFEGKLFNITACSTLSEEIVDAMVAEVPDAAAMFARKNAAWSGIIGPDGAVIGEPIIDVEGIAYATIDLAKCVQPTQMHNITGHYNRFDVFSFSVNTSAQGPEAALAGPIDLTGSNHDEPTETP
ncbi:MAG: carbon-nitrogen hydrolase family protein [Acidimicrobiales bacterium]